MKDDTLSLKRGKIVISYPQKNLENRMSFWKLKVIVENHQMIRPKFMKNEFGNQVDGFAFFISVDLLFWILIN